MSDRTLKYPPGTAITFTTGCYSDFSTRGTLITLKDVDLAACAQAFHSEVKLKDAEADARMAAGGKHEWVDTDPAGLVAWLIVNGHAMAAAVEEVHLGDYGNFEPEFGVPEN